MIIFSNVDVIDYDISLGEFNIADDGNKTLFSDD